MSHHFPALILTIVQQWWTEVRLKARLHVLDKAPALQDLLLQSTEIIHMTDGVAPITVGERSVRSLSLQFRVRVQ